MEAAHKDKIPKRKNKVNVGNEITTPNYGCIKTCVEITSCSQVFNYCGRISNSGRKFKGPGSTSPKVER
jgi:hypothetical protein